MTDKERIAELEKENERLRGEVEEIKKRNKELHDTCYAQQQVYLEGRKLKDAEVDTLKAVFQKVIDRYYNDKITGDIITSEVLSWMEQALAPKEKERENG